MLKIRIEIVEDDGPVQKVHDSMELEADNMETAMGIFADLDEFFEQYDSTEDETTDE